MLLIELSEHEIHSFDSDGVAMRFMPTVGGTSIHLARVAAGGTLGRHPTVRRQLFAVVAGRGEVQAGDEHRVPIGPGSLVVWEPGEVHQTWATTDLTAVVVETSEELDVDAAR